MAKQSIALRRCRGAAMTELLFLAFPYGIMAVGIFMLGSVMIGKQEAVQSMAWAATTPQQQGTSDAESYFFNTQNDGVVLDDQEDHDPGADPKDDEPVLPYEPEDIQAVISRTALVINYSATDGMVHVGNSVVGRRLQYLGLMDSSSAVGTYDPDSISSVSFNVEQAYCQEMADMLGSWLNFSRANVQFTYDLKTGQPKAINAMHDNGERLPESRTYGLSNPEAYSSYSTTLNEDARHEVHDPDGRNIDLSKMNSFSAETDTYSGVVAPSDISPNYSFDDDSELWDKDFAYE